MATSLRKRVRRCADVSLENGGVWDLGYSCRTSARLTTQLLTHNHRAIKDRVAPALGIDKESRRIKGTLIRSEDGKRILTASELQPINKALGWNC